MSRPRLEEDKKLSERFIFRLSKDELNRINKAAENCGKQPGPLVREKLFKGKFPEAKAAKLDLFTYTELKRIGNNLNQLTKLAHSRIVPIGLQQLLLKLLQQQEIILKLLLHDRRPENR
ncbi:plasmid mobilization protein [Mucilaginibacter jinjuensis]|uniref:Plasmid mobilization relaxosome protein MobC n=1 Tax=Mucilaginibacter jinjuensis TaxID=1176721 RepID=A0ABY7TBQ3_9SPHI|nr:plasmid mobilization relaxosome protein MobC [Mucilaginibacter jinjuensis]WCT13495.1 plasmid mobilization relaxosome protein MobC [Mucilaginibacter jinjuensis]